jgi:hypothetical protein
LTGASSYGSLQALPAAPGATTSGPLARAVEFLWAQQAEDGGFHSSTYGLLRSGQSLTPFALGALLDVPESVARRPDKGIDRALEFIRKNTNAQGELGRWMPRRRTTRITPPRLR